MAACLHVRHHLVLLRHSRCGTATQGLSVSCSTETAPCSTQNSRSAYGPLHLCIHRTCYEQCKSNASAGPRPAARRGSSGQLTRLTPFLCAPGIAYDIINEPPAVGGERDPVTGAPAGLEEDDQQPCTGRHGAERPAARRCASAGAVRPITFMPYRMNGQFIFEGLSGGFFYTLGGAAHGPRTSGRSAQQLHAAASGAPIAQNPEDALLPAVARGAHMPWAVHATSAGLRAQAWASSSWILAATRMRARCSATSTCSCERGLERAPLRPVHLQLSDEHWLPCASLGGG
jgi:hypothetical protein